MDCPYIRETDLGEWGLGLLKRLGTGRYPLSGSMELTERCNLSCIHCLINQPAGSQAAASRELRLDQIREILDQVVDAGCLFMLLTGGEPLLRPDFSEIYHHATRKGLLVTLFTNGTLVTPGIADLLAEYRPQAVEISLYGYTQATYEQVTQVPGSHARCMSAIELLLERRVPLSLKTVVLRANCHEIEDARAFARERGLTFRTDSLIWPRLDGDRHPLTQRLAPSEIVATERLDLVDEQERRMIQTALDASPLRAGPVYNCGAGERGFHIDSVGHLSMCLMSRSPAFDLTRGSFLEGWNGPLSESRRKQRALATRCETCRAGTLCAQCTAWSQASHGDDETPDDFVCQVGQLRQAKWQATNLYEHG